MVLRPPIYIAVIVALSGAAGCGSPPATAPETHKTDTTFYTPADFASVKKYDTHVHINIRDSALVHQARLDNFRLLTVNVTPAYYPRLEEQQRIAVEMVKKFPGMLAYATTFSLDNFNTPGWQQHQLDYLKDSFDKGAIAVKIWKNVGMELRNGQGKFVMADDVKFDSIFSYLASRHIPLLGHLGEPRNAWLPLDKMTINGDRSYFTKHPEYHMFLHPEYPTYEDQVRARDHLLEKHPDLTFIGAHLGSLEWNIDSLASRFERFPNMAVDMAARLSAIQYQAVTKGTPVRDFFMKYQDRLIYATDLEQHDTTDVAAFQKRVHDKWLDDFTFFVSDSTMSTPAFEGSFKGLHLPAGVVDKIFGKNAVRWFPGIDK